MILILSLKDIHKNKNYKNKLYYLLLVIKLTIY